MKLNRTLLLLTAAAGLANAQLAAPNARGVASGHMHLNVTDPAVQKKFWTEVIGAQVYDEKGLTGVRAPGVIVLFRTAKPTGGSIGSTVNHIGFTVPNVDPYLGKVESAGYTHTPVNANRQIFVDGPDGLRVELSENKNESVPLRFHHVHFNIPDPKAAQTWYAEKFGATITTRAKWDAGDVPGANLTYAAAEGAVTPTVGRALDHIGFEVKNLEAFCKKLAESGVKFETPYHPMPQMKLAWAFLTDPWGTRIELTEGLE